MADSIAPFVTIRAGGGYVDLALSPMLIVSGRRLTKLIKQLAKRFACHIAAGTGGGSQFIIRLHGAPVPVAEALRQELPYEATEGRFDPHGQPLVRCVDAGIAYIDPGHELPLANYLTLAEQLAEQSGQRVVLAHRQEALILTVIKEIAGGQVADEQYDDFLKEKLNPAYRLTASLSGGVNGSGNWISMSMTSSSEVDLAVLSQLPFVLSQPAPHATVRKNQNHRVRFNIKGNPTNVEKMWQLAAKAALAVGVHPIGNFRFQPNERTKVDYMPEPISNW